MYLCSAVILMLVIWSCQSQMDAPPTAPDSRTFQARIHAPNGEPVAFASVILLRRGSFTLEARTTSDAKGRFSVEVDPGKAPWWLLTRDAHETYLDTSFLFTPSSSTHVLSPAPRPPPLEPSGLEAPDGPGEKKVADGDLRGDVDGSGEVNHWDMMLLLYHLVGWPALGSSYDFDLADINSDGATDWTDLALLGAWIHTNPKPVNTYRIGEPMSTDSTNERRMQASLSPDPSGTTFTADGETWHQFRLSVITALGHQGRYSDRVNVKIDAPSILKVYLWASIIYGCGDDLDEHEFYNLQSVSFLACREGSANIILEDEDGNELNRYAVKVEARNQRNAETSFNIELVFVPRSSYTEHQKDLFRQAAARWERVITADIPDEDYYTYYPLDTRDFTGEWDTWWTNDMRPYFGDIRVDDVVDDVRVFVAGPVRDDSFWGRGGAIRFRASLLQNHHPILSTIHLSRDLMDENDNKVYRVMLHEIGHTLGFTDWIFEKLSLLHNPSEDHPAHLPAPDSYFSGSKAVTAFNLSGGSRYRGNKVPLENDPDRGSSRDSHWRESVMDGELMTSESDVEHPLSSITIQAMADMGYTVDVSEAESYNVPLVAAKVTAAARERPFCQVIRPPQGL